MLRGTAMYDVRTQGGRELDQCPKFAVNTTFMDFTDKGRGGGVSFADVKYGGAKGMVSAPKGRSVSVSVVCSRFVN